MTDAQQLSLFVTTARSPSELLRVLQNGGAPSVDLTLTRNRVSMATVSFPPGAPVRLRLHEAYASAPEAVLAALAVYLRTRRRADWRVVCDFARSITVASVPRRLPRLAATGTCWDLSAIGDEVNREFFSGRIAFRIGWGRSRPVHRRGRRSRSIRYGSWDVATGTIRIHPLLDDAQVPREFVRYIVFHEMLHAAVPQERVNNRRYDHSPRFRALERGFPNLPEMRRLAQALLNVLL